MSNTITVPVLASFGQEDQPIGLLTIEKDKLPPTTGYHFALGYTTPKPVRADGQDEPYELYCVAIVPSHLFRA